jgi:hypothetical protein
MIARGDGSEEGLEGCILSRRLLFGLFAIAAGPIVAAHGVRGCVERQGGKATEQRSRAYCLGGATIASGRVFVLEALFDEVVQERAATLELLQKEDWPLLMVKCGFLAEVENVMKIPVALN